MSDKRYQVVYTGRLVSGADAGTVMSNLVLDLGIAESKARALLESGRVVLKRFPSNAEAQRLAEKFERAGALCVVEDNAQKGSRAGKQVSGESSLITLISRFRPVSRREQEIVAAEGNP